MKKPKFAWTRFLSAIKKIDQYHAFSCDISGYPQAALTFTFKSPLQAKIFLWWVLEIGGTDKYEATVYFNDVLPEAFEEVPPNKPPRDIVGVE